MQDTQPDNIIAAMDIGTSKVEVAVADVSVPGEIDVIGIGNVSSFGVDGGCIKDVELAVESIRRATSEACETSGISITHVTAALTGKGLHCINKVGKLVLANDEVTEEDVKTATKLAMMFDPKVHDTDTDPALRSEDDMVVMHSIKGYTIDDDDTLIADPVGMACSVLKAHVHLAIGSESIALNLIKCIRKAGLDVDGVVMQPWASAASCLTPTEKELGVVLLDFGAGATDIACFQGNQIQYTAVVPMGSNLLSRDIASVLGCSLDDAEEIKGVYAHIGVRDTDSFTKIRYKHEASGAEREVPVTEIVRITEPRVAEILQIIATEHLMRDNWLGRAASGIVITGGMAKLPGLVKLIKQLYGLPVRIGEPIMVHSTRFALTDPEDATIMGVLSEARHRSEMGVRQTVRAHTGVWGFIRNIFYGDFSD